MALASSMDAAIAKLICIPPTKVAELASSAPKTAPSTAPPTWRRVLKMGSSLDRVGYVG